MIPANHISEPAKELLTGAEKDMNAAIAQLRQFETTRSNDTVKKRVVTIPNGMVKLVKLLNEIIREG